MLKTKIIREADFNFYVVIYYPTKYFNMTLIKVGKPFKDSLDAEAFERSSMVKSIIKLIEKNPYPWIRCTA